MHLLAHYLEALAVLIQTWLGSLKKKKNEILILWKIASFSLIAVFKTVITSHLTPI